MAGALCREEVRGFMAREHPLGFAPGGDFGAVGYEPPPPGSTGKHEQTRTERVADTHRVSILSQVRQANMSRHAQRE